MTRLANLEKAGYFPLPAPVTELVQTYLAALHGGRVLDPCAGEGEALVAFAKKLGLDPYGVELHEGRAAAARQAVTRLLESRSEVGEQGTRILQDSYLNLVTSRGGYNFLYLNPPYDHDDEDGGDRFGRLEYQWLVRCRPRLQTGGCCSGWCRSTCSSCAKPPATSSPGTSRCGFTVSPMACTSVSGRSCSLACTGRKPSCRTARWWNAWPRWRLTRMRCFH